MLNSPRMSSTFLFNDGYIIACWQERTRWILKFLSCIYLFIYLSIFVKIMQLDISKFKTSRRIYMENSPCTIIPHLFKSQPQRHSILSISMCISVIFYIYANKFISGFPLRGTVYAFVSISRYSYCVVTNSGGKKKYSLGMLGL